MRCYDHMYIAHYAVILSEQKQQHLAPLYANWCLNNMLQDSKTFFESTSKKQNQ